MMGAGLRERLAKKPKRRAVVPVELGQPSDEDQRRVVLAQAQQLSAIKDGDQERVDELQKEIDDLQAENIAKVCFTALAPDDFEKVVALYTTDEGDIDRDKALPILAALCADDEDLQDDEWWAAQLAAGTWNKGEVNALWRALLHINTEAPNPYVPKD